MGSYGETAKMWRNLTEVLGPIVMNSLDYYCNCREN